MAALDQSSNKRKILTVGEVSSRYFAFLLETHKGQTFARGCKGLTFVLGGVLGGVDIR